MKIPLLCMGLILATFAPINAQIADIYYYDDSAGYAKIASNEVSTSSKFLTISWVANDKFQPPYTVIQLAEADTVAAYAVPFPSVVVDMSSAATSTLRVSGSGGGQFSIVLRKDVAWAEWLFISLLVVAMVAVVAMLFFVRWRSKMPASGPLAATSGRTKKFECVTILFADIQGFTKITTQMNPEQLVDELDRYFIYFDELVERYSVEKIKTIGDAYMCAGGVPDADSANPIEVVLVGLAMIEYVKERQSSVMGFWNIRVGINTGPVIAGMLGFKKKAFDIWGDAVNTASRMESSSAAGAVNVSGETYHKVCDYFDCEYRGKMPVKYKGEVDMYFVKSLKPEYREGGSLYRPNALLMQKMQILKIHDLEQIVITEMLAEAHANKRKRFEMFLTRVELLARAEQLRDNDAILCKVSAILSFAQTNFHREYRHVFGDTNAILRRMHFTEEQIADINKVTMRIVQNKRPECQIEEVIADAKNEYLCRKDFIALSLERYDCVVDEGKRMSKKDWFAEQQRQLSNLQYYTESAKSLAETTVAEQMKIVDQIIHSC